jgi:hypothetical protein
VSFPIKNGDVPFRYVKLPEGIPLIINYDDIELINYYELIDDIHMC